MRMLNSWRLMHFSRTSISLLLLWKKCKAKSFSSYCGYSWRNKYSEVTPFQVKEAVIRNVFQIFSRNISIKWWDSGACFIWRYQRYFCNKKYGCFVGFFFCLGFVVVKGMWMWVIEDIKALQITATEKSKQKKFKTWIWNALEFFLFAEFIMMMWNNSEKYYNIPGSFLTRSGISLKFLQFCSAS